MARRAELRYGAKLRRLAQHIGELVSSHNVESLDDLAKLQEALLKYSQVIEPWAQSLARTMVEEVRRRDYEAWRQTAKEMGQELWQQIQTAPTGQVFQQLMQEQVTLIKSLPLEASQRVHELVTKGLVGSERGEDVFREIMRTGAVTKSRATLIARTETARATTVLTQARATYVGSEGYIWRTAEDEIVRESHKKMEGKFCRWDSPPQVEAGRFYHAGCFPNCRCVPEPVIPDIYG